MEAAEKRLLDITAGEFAEILADKIAAKIKTDKAAEPEQADVIEGLKGLSQYLKININKLWRMRQKGQLAEAETKMGERTFYYSKSKIDQIFK